MNSHKYFYVIGLMSGTSLDGVDFCYVRFYIDKNSQWQYDILATACYDYPDDWVEKLAYAHLLNNDEIFKLNHDYTKLIAKNYINKFLENVQPKHIDFISTHGHTIFHQPEKRLTLQIGNLPNIANIVGYPVICDFRVQDVKKGGQGAPLVPIGDLLLFQQYDVCINIGGFVNISLKKNKRFMAYDVCPANKVLNHLCQKIGFRFDQNGSIAAKANVNKKLLHQLNNLDYYKLPPPKSLGVEWLESFIFPLLSESELSVEEQIATFTEHIADQLSRQIPVSARVLLTGGGAFNQHLIHRLEHKISTKILLPQPQLINYKEALIFAFLGVLRYNNQNNILASVTGAPADHLAGYIYYPK